MGRVTPLGRALLLSSVLGVTGCIVYAPPVEPSQRARPARADGEPGASSPERRHALDPVPPMQLPRELSWPLDGPTISGFGTARRGTAHQGIDIRAPRGSTIRAAAAGRVIQSGWMNGYGNVVSLDHGDGVETRYAHTAENFVRVGAWVERGERIAAVGATGNATTPHLHFEVRTGGRPRDPVAWLPREALSHPAAIP